MYALTNAHHTTAHIHPGPILLDEFVDYLKAKHTGGGAEWPSSFHFP